MLTSFTFGGARTHRDAAKIGKPETTGVILLTASRTAEINDALALDHHPGRAAHFAVEERHSFVGQWRERIAASPAPDANRTDHDLSRSRRVEQPFGPHTTLSSAGRPQTREDDVGLRRDVRWRTRRDAAGLFEFRPRAAPIATTETRFSSSCGRSGKSDLAMPTKPIFCISKLRRNG